MSGTDLTEKRKNRRDRIETGHKAVEFAKKHNKPLYGNYWSLCRDWIQIANVSALVGDIEEARREFATSGLYIRALNNEFLNRYEDIEQDRRERVGVHLQWGIYTSILSGDRRLIDALATDIQSLAENFSEDYSPDFVVSYWIARTAACLYERADEAAMEYLEQYRANDDTAYTKLHAAIHQSLCNTDIDATRRAIGSLVDEHHDIFNESWDWKKELSHAGAVSILLAREREMDITAAEFDSEYVPVEFDEFDIGDNIELPEPEYVDDELIPN